MANSINSVQILGNLTKDPEIKESQNGIKIAKVSIATNQSIKKGDEWEDVPEYHSVVAFGKAAEYVEKTCQKGTKVHVTGRLKTNSWDDSEGAKRYRTDIISENVIVLDRRKERIDEVDDAPEFSEPKKKAPNPDDFPMDDIPF